jgi:glycerophosphoryl diester phosphodiesterase
VTVWTLNDPEMARDLAAIGVTAIITDDPGLMSQALR